MGKDNALGIQNDYLVKTGEKLAYWRMKRRMSQEQLAEALGLSASTIFRYETAVRQMSLTTMYKAAKVLQISPNDLSPEELVVNARTQSNTGINFKFYKLAEKDQKLLELFIDRLLHGDYF